ncbi:MAG: hypothetical protein CMH52_02405 [Myxococcales bacterium]|nr:hypothetical protein [Myxococcales bacterium]
MSFWVGGEYRRIFLSVNEEISVFSLADHPVFIGVSAHSSYFRPFFLIQIDQFSISKIQVNPDS